MPSRDFDAWMWAEACEVLERAERLHRQFFKLAAPHAKRPTWEPPIDVYETERDFWILVALPGIEAEHVEVIFNRGILTVSGERHLPISPQAEIHRLEIPHGRFERRIELPQEPLEVTRREFVNGCLLITLRKL
jgi:HSP20 family molecular chaperone IbpA